MRYTALRNYELQANHCKGPGSQRFPAHQPPPPNLTTTRLHCLVSTSESRSLALGVALRGGHETDGPLRRLCRRCHELVQCIEDLLQLHTGIPREGFMLQGEQLSFLFQCVQLGGKLVVRAQSFAQATKARTT